MLWALIVALFVMWVLGYAAFNIAGGLIHILLVIALILFVVQLFTGRRTVV